MTTVIEMKPNTDERTGRFIPSAVVCGRRVCTAPYHQGKRWLPIVFFHVSEWEDEAKTIPKRLQSWCTTCQREHVRVRDGHGARQPSETGYKRKTREEQERYREYSRKKYSERTEQQKRDEREYARIYAIGRRRREGKSERSLRRLQKPTNTHLRPEADESVFNAVPLCDFLTELVHRHGNTAIAAAAKISGDRLYEFVNHEVDTVTLELADRILTGLGYPEEVTIMFPEEEE